MPRQKKETRAMYYSVNATAMNRTAQSNLTKIRAKLDKLQVPWAEVDPMIETATARATAAIDELMSQYKDSAAYLNEPMEA